mgnify:CR=1 FL=1
MTRKRRQETISAYLDGAVRNPGRVEQHLQENTEAAAYHAEMKKLSEQIRSLTPPVVSPAFTTRVMARVAQEDMERARPRWLWVGLPATAAALLVVVGAIMWVFLQTSPDSSGPSQFATLDPDALSDLIEFRIAQGEGLPWDEDIEFEEGNASDDLLPDATYDAVVSSDLFNRMLAALDADTDLITALEYLDTEETNALRGFLVEYVMEG